MKLLTFPINNVKAQIKKILFLEDITNSVEEIEKIFQEILYRKAPMSDIFIGKFYKTFKNKIFPMLS